MSQNGGVSAAGRNRISYYFNSNPETNFVVRTGSNFQNIVAVLDPRVVKIGIRFQF
jgi:hypothetical protein